MVLPDTPLPLKNSITIINNNNSYWTGLILILNKIFSPVVKPGIIF